MKPARLLAVFLFILPLRLPALLFEPLQTPNGDVLLIRDCGTSNLYSRKYSNELAKLMSKRDSAGCQDYQTQFAGEDKKAGYPGDAEALNQVLREQRNKGRQFAEVWLFSGGGAVNAAVKMARTFRANQLTVRIKQGFYCVSACTLAFMGGYFRYMDEGATYQVHSASSVATGFESKDTLNSEIEDVRKNAEQGILEFAKEEQTYARFSAMQILRLFQNTLTISVNKSMREDDEAFSRRANSDVPHWGYLDADSKERAMDVARIETEGPAAIQDVLMKIERDAMSRAIEELEASAASLGARAPAALRMLRLMYMTSIKETAILNRTTMLEMGYLTEEFNPQ